MAYFSEEMPKPAPNIDDEGFWRSCNERQLRFQGCVDCGAVRHPPTPICGSCLSTQTTWVDAPNVGEVFTFTVVWHASHPAVAQNLPYVVAVVEFPALPGVRLVSNVTDCDATEVCIGMQVALWWDEVSPGVLVPRFRPTGQERVT